MNYKERRVNRVCEKLRRREKEEEEFEGVFLCSPM